MTIYYTTEDLSAAQMGQPLVFSFPNNDITTFKKSPMGPVHNYSKKQYTA